VPPVARYQFTAWVDRHLVAKRAEDRIARVRVRFDKVNLSLLVVWLVRGFHGFVHLPFVKNDVSPAELHRLEHYDSHVFIRVSVRNLRNVPAPCQIR